MADNINNFSSSKTDLVRKALAVLLHAWYKKMQRPELIRGNAKPPVLNAEVVTEWMELLRGLKYSHWVNEGGKNRYKEVPPDDPNALKEYEELESRIADHSRMAWLANRLNQAIVKPEVIKNLLEKQHTSLLSMVLSDQSSSSNAQPSHTIKTYTGSLLDGKTYWFTLNSVYNKLGGKNLDKLAGHLCSYTMYDPHDVYGGKSGKVIVCPTEAAGIQNIPARVANAINSKLREKYNVDRDYATVKELSQISYNNKAGDSSEARTVVVTGIKHTGMTYGVDIDCSERIDVGGALIDPRKAVSELFKNDELPFTFTEPEVHSQTEIETDADDDVDYHGDKSNKVIAQVAASHETMIDQRDSSVLDAQLSVLENRRVKVAKCVEVLNSLAKVQLQNGGSIWNAAEFKVPPKSKDVYVNHANYVTSVSDYILESTSGVFSNEDAPFAFEAIYSHHNVKFATNTVPNKNNGHDHITLDRYAHTMHSILDSINARLTDDTLKSIIKSAKLAVGILKLYEEGVYDLLSGVLEQYSEKSDVSKLDKKRQAVELAEKYQNTPINVKLMDRAVGFDLSEKYQGMLKSTMTLGDYLDKASRWLEKVSEQGNFGVDENADVANGSEKLVTVNSSIKVLLNGNLSNKAVTYLDMIIKAANADSTKSVSPAQADKPQQPMQTHAPDQEPAKTEEPPKQPVEEPKPVDKPAAEPTSDDDDDFNGDEI